MVKDDLVGINGVKHVHSLNIWSLTLSKTALTVHLAIGMWDCFLVNFIHMHKSLINTNSLPSLYLSPIKLYRSNVQQWIYNRTCLFNSNWEIWDPPSNPSGWTIQINYGAMQNMPKLSTHKRETQSVNYFSRRKTSPSNDACNWSCIMLTVVESIRKGCVKRCNLTVT